ncbi:biotin--[acetyl-CoA-carboxylase] ligase [Kaistella montana]|uniref:Biotin--[acetyl-CoA-carboxylase] ligase n=1 Tax=Kaistella montana TaxID=1849733 RepID=A0ABW5KCF7_9FLAO|nr:biotin--[acetyl-CoA-carboxylase] ligase [Kaistella montana]MCQ4035950.1 biotin--[acetyl-CoA-carboxylase] ligase [Kaistella montana]
MSALVFLEKCTSTNDEILKHFTLKQSANLALYTFNQTQGRGQYGNNWNLSVNQNLAFSMILSADRFVIRDQFINFRTAEVLANFLAIMTKSPVEIKWPNDLIINNKKVAGILIEKKNINGISYFIIGIGLNILQVDFQELSKAGSLFTQTGKKFELHNFTEKLYSYLVENLAKNVSEENILKEINQRLFKKDKVSVFSQNGMRQNGIIKNVDEEGFLWVDLENDGLKKFYHKEIELLY